MRSAFRVVLAVFLLLPVSSIGHGEPATAAAPDLVPDPFPEAVEALAADYGIDEDEARTRLRHQHELYVLSEAVEELDPEAFAGAWIDHSDGGTFNVASSRDLGATASTTLAELVSGEVASRLQIHRTEYSLRDLYAIRDSVLERRDALQRNFGPVSVGVSARDNAVTLEVVDADGRVELPRLVQEVGQGVEVLRTEREAEPDCTRFACDHEGLMRGGLRINSCTSGFTAWSPNNSSRYTMTAGHCYNAPTSAFHNGVRVGGVPYSSWQTTGTMDADAARIIIDSGNFVGTRWVWHTAGAQRLAITAVVNSNTIKSSGQGTYICRSGSADALRCGEITDADTQSVQNDGQRTIRNVFVYGVRGCAGDSGAPVYSSTSPRTAFGIHIAGAGSDAGSSLLTNSACRSQSQANHINDVEDELTIYVLTN